MLGADLRPTDEAIKPYVEHLAAACSLPKWECRQIVLDSWSLVKDCDFEIAIETLIRLARIE